MSLKQHGHFATNGFMFPLFRQMLQNTEKTTLNLWIVVNRIKCKRFLKSKPITFVSSMSNFSDFNFYIRIYPINVSWENTDDICHIYMAAIDPFLRMMARWEIWDNMDYFHASMGY